MKLQSRTTVALLTVSASLFVAIAGHEGFKDTAYVPVPGDVPTIGFGTTKEVRMGDRITPVRAMVRLLDEVEGVYGEGVKRCVTVPLYQHEYEAFVSLSYNIGVGAFCRKALPGKSPNLIDLINMERYAEACERIDAFVYGPGKKKLPGLIKRRAKERALCEGRDINNQ